MKITETLISLDTRNGKKMEFKIYSDLSDEMIYNAIDCWAARTKNLNGKSLKDYIKSKISDAIVLTEKEFKNIKQ